MLLNVLFKASSVDLPWRLEKNVHVFGNFPNAVFRKQLSKSIIIHRACFLCVLSECAPPPSCQATTYWKFQGFDSSACQGFFFCLFVLWIFVVTAACHYHFFSVIIFHMLINLK